MEDKIQKDLQQYLLSHDKIDERMPECPDVEGYWQQIAQAYIPDGIREFNAYPTVSLGWMMFLGMAIAKYWDEDWQKYSQAEGLYEQMRAQRGFDCLDEYILEDVLHMKGEGLKQLNDLVAECASRTYNTLCHEHIEPGTREAFDAYVACLHQLYLMGAAIQLKRMGYHMTLLWQGSEPSEVCNKHAPFPISSHAF